MGERDAEKLEGKVGLVHDMYYSAWSETVTQELRS